MRRINIVLFLQICSAGVLVAQRADSVQITLERLCTGFGNFSEYRLTINGGGLVIYEERGDDTRVSHNREPYRERTRKHIAPSTVDSLVQQFLRINYFSLEDHYYSKTIRSAPGQPLSITMEMVSDMHTCVTSLRVGDQTKRVINYYGAPPELSVLEDRIDSLAGLPDFNRDLKKALK